MYTFRDYYNNEVTLSFANHPFSKNPKHVLTICRYNDKWLLTEHKERGLEFPGGKVDISESAVEGAIREVKEETGAIIENIDYIGQYYVKGKNDRVIKNIYYAQIKELLNQDSYFETNGPVLLDAIPTNVKQNKSFSFIMKDDVLYYSLKFIEQKNMNSELIQND